MLPSLRSPTSYRAWTRPYPGIEPLKSTRNSAAPLQGPSRHRGGSGMGQRISGTAALAGCIVALIASTAPFALAVQDTVAPGAIKTLETVYSAQAETTATIRWAAP